MLIICRTFLEGKKVRVILGDNIFYGKGFEKFLEDISAKNDNVLFSQKVNKPENLGILKEVILEDQK